MRALAKALAYGAVELCTAGRGVRLMVNQMPVRFPPRWARFYPHEYEPGKFAFLREQCRPGSVALDIGAHIGLFSILLARSVGPSGHVYCFEPTPKTRRILERTVRLNGCDAIAEVRPEAVSSTSGAAFFHDTGDLASNANSLIHGARSRFALSVETITVDDFVAARRLLVSCIKIDVEGAEWDVLRGAERTIATCRPALVIELHPDALERSGQSVDSVCALLEEYELEPSLDGHPITYDWLRRQTQFIEIQLLPRDRIASAASKPSNDIT